MVFAKLWLVGLLVAVLFVAAIPPTTASIIVNNELPGQDPATVIAAAPPCPDVTTAQVAAAEGRMVERLERNRLELQTEIAQTVAAAADADQRMTQLGDRLRLAENEAAERKAELQGIRRAMIAPLVMTWVIVAAAAGVIVVGGCWAIRARRTRTQGRSATEAVRKE
jgi:hypothetical protein